MGVGGGGGGGGGGMQGAYNMPGNGEGLGAYSAGMSGGHTLSNIPFGTSHGAQQQMPGSSGPYGASAGLMGAGGRGFGGMGMGMGGGAMGGGASIPFEDAGGPKPPDPTLRCVLFSMYVCII